jgi:molecular chaperone DnaK (HSP70)
VYTPEQVLAMFFTHLKQTAESNLAPQKVIDVVVSVCAAY